MWCSSEHIVVALWLLYGAVLHQTRGLGGVLAAPEQVGPGATGQRDGWRHQPVRMMPGPVLLRSQW